MPFFTCMIYNKGIFPLTTERKPGYFWSDKEAAEWARWKLTGGYRKIDRGEQLRFFRQGRW